MKRLFRAFLGFFPFFALIVPLKPQSESADQELNFENYYKYVPYEADKLQFQSAVSSKIHISTAKSFPIELLSAYTFYHYDVGVRNYYVADVLNPNCFSQNIVQLMIIDKADETDKIDSSLEGKSIIRISRFVDGRLYVKDSPISERLVQDISKISRKAEDGSEEFKTTVTSLNLIFDLEKDIARNLEEANLSQPQAVDVLPGGPILPPIFPPISKYEYLEPLPDEIEVADNQATLDYYLSIKDIFGQITVNYANTIFPNPKRNSMTFFDDPITTIIPKKYFENPGVATVVGKEFGYCIETVNNLSSVLIFDITHTISKNDSGITIGIVPVIHSNYFFDETKNTVFQGAPNNLCLANPSLTAQIRYLNLEDDANSVKHPNPGDIDYVQSEDNGAYFSSFMSKIKGKSQKYEKDEVLSTLKYIVGSAADLFISLLPIPTSASILAEYAVDLVISNIFDELVGEDYSTDNSIGGDSKNIEIEVGKINETPNFASARKDDDTFWKIAKLETGGNKQIYVKTDDDYALFMYNIGRPDPINETWDPYTIGIENRLTALIIEDNTSIFNFTPRKIDDFLVDFGSVIGDSIQVAKTKNVKEGNRYSFGHGSGRTQSLKFVPKEAGRYLFTLDNVTCATETIKSSDADFSNPVVKTKWYDYDINQVEKREGKSSISYIVDLEKKEYNFTIGDGLTKALQNQGTTGTLEISKIELDNLDIEDYRFGSWERALYVSPSFENGYTIGVSPSKNEIFSLTASPDSPSESASLIYRDSQGRRLSLASGLNSSFFRALPGEKYYFSTKSKSSSSLILEETDLLPTLRKNVGNAFLKVHIDYQKTTDVSYAFMVSEEGLLEIDPHVNYINPNFIIEIENVTTGQKKTAVNGSLSIEVNPDCLYNLNILYGAYDDLESSIIQMILI